MQKEGNTTIEMGCIESLRQILEDTKGEPVTLEQARKTGAELVDFYVLLADGLIGAKP